MATLQTEITNAFEEIASTSSSTPTKKAVYDVFINHRGIDVKKTLASSIYNTLHRMGFRVFLDEEELELGDNIPAEIEDAMRTSFLHIAIFSPNYAQSPWCLAELSYMLKTGTRIIPVFYDVDPSDLRWAAKEKGTYADAFSEHEAKNYYSPEKLKDWKMALQQVSNRSGSILKKDDDEGMLLKSITNYVMKYLKKVSVPLEVARHPVGLQEAVQDFERCALQSSQNVQIIGIVSMGGSGKTTLGKELYNKKSSSITRCSFLFDVRDAASKKLLHNKQKTLLEDLKLEHSSFDNVEKGKQILASSLRSLCFLIVLDDVDHLDQLDALLPGRDSFASGSLIIVTSREKDVLESWGITCIYNMKLLAPDHATQLLCWHAFLRHSPLEGFEALVEKFVDVCKGLPLSLKVFGGQLYRKPKAYWESLNFKGCKKLQELPLLTNQRSLRELLVMEMDSLKELPSNIGELSKLEVLRIGSHLWASLPTSLGNLSSLTRLQIDTCRKVKSLPTSLGNLSSLTHLEIKCCRKLKSLPTSLGNLCSLTRLTITSCEMVESLPESMGNLHLLQNLHISWTGIKSLPKALAQLSNLQDLSINGCPIKELDFESGSSSSLLYNLKSIRLRNIDVSRISISQHCCPSLETLHLYDNEHLTDIQTLPVSLKVVKLYKCEMLKSISGICGLLNLQELVIEVSLERLRRVELQFACDISAFRLQKWPSESLIVWGRTEDDVDSLLKSFTFDTDFSLVDSCSDGGMRLKSGQRRSSNAAVMLCFILNSFYDFSTELHVRKDGIDITSYRNGMWVGKGKWVWIGVSTDASWLMAEEYSLDISRRENVDVWGMLVMGKQERVVEGFYKLLAR